MVDPSSIPRLIQKANFVSKRVRSVGICKNTHQPSVQVERKQKIPRLIVQKNRFFFPFRAVLPVYPLMADLAGLLTSADLLTVDDCEAGRMETEEEGHRGVDGAPAASSRSAGAGSAIHPVHMGRDRGSGGRIDPPIFARRSSQRHQAPPVLGSRPARTHPQIFFFHRRVYRVHRRGMKQDYG